MSIRQRVALEALKEEAARAFDELGEAVYSAGQQSGEGIDFDSGAGGLSRDLLQRITKHSSAAGGCKAWLESLPEEECSLILINFLDTDSIRRTAFRRRYPMAGSKWDPEEDAALVETYRTGGSLKALSDTLGRNINALRLRLEKLGVDLPENEKGRRIYFSKN